MARAAADDGHSRRVAVLKRALPLLALALMATVFLVLRTEPPRPYTSGTDDDATDLLTAPRMTAPSFAGVASDGTEVLLRARTASPPMAPGAGAQVSGAALTLRLPTGRTIEAEAAEARLDPGQERIVLSGGVSLSDPHGWQVEIETLIAPTDGSSLESPAPVAAQGPAGKVDAGGMVFDRSAGPGREVLVFNRGVRLLYTPPKIAPAPAAGPATP
jgi:lipopolysaccharide export system protein LptC